jgi:hypothetical protein
MQKEYSDAGRARTIPVPETRERVRQLQRGLLKCACKRTATHVSSSGASCEGCFTDRQLRRQREEVAALRRR